MVHSIGFTKASNSHAFTLHLKSKVLICYNTASTPTTPQQHLWVNIGSKLQIDLADASTDCSTFSVSPLGLTGVILCQTEILL
jgi:hypothetical protein